MLVLKYNREIFPYIGLAERIVELSTFYSKLLEIKSFDFCPLDGFGVVQGIRKKLTITPSSNGLTCAVIPYRTFNPWSKVMGYSDTHDIYLNTRKIWTPEQTISTVVHELGHVIFPEYSHGNNTLKPNCVQETMARIAVEIFKESYE